MTLKVDVNGHKDLYKLAAVLRDAGERKLGQKLTRGVRNGAKAIEVEVRKSSDVYMPRGFEQTFKRSLKVKVSVKTARDRSISVTFTAMGKKDQRHLDEMEAGRLAHPVHGRYRKLKSGRRKKNPWVKPPQRIRPGVISEPAKRTTPKVARAIDNVMGELVREINRAT